MRASNGPTAGPERATLRGLSGWNKAGGQQLQEPPALPHDVVEASRVECGDADEALTGRAFGHASRTRRTRRRIRRPARFEEIAIHSPFANGGGRFGVHPRGRPPIHPRIPMPHRTGPIFWSPRLAEAG